MRKTTYKEFKRYIIDKNKTFKIYYYFSTEEGYEYQKDGIKFYIRKDGDEWNVSIELGFRVLRCNSYKEVIDFLESLDIQNTLLPAMEKGKEFIKSHRNEIVEIFNEEDKRD